MRVRVVWRFSSAQFGFMESLCNAKPIFASEILECADASALWVRCDVSRRGKSGDTSPHFKRQAFAMPFYFCCLAFKKACLENPLDAAAEKNIRAPAGPH